MDMRAKPLEPKMSLETRYLWYSFIYCLWNHCSSTVLEQFQVFMALGVSISYSTIRKTMYIEPPIEYGLGGLRVW